MLALPCFNNMNIIGKGKVSAKPDIAVVILGVETKNKSLKIAQEENSIKASKLINALLKAGIDSKDIQTLGYNMEEEYDYIQGKQVFRDYRVRNTLKLIIRNINKVGEIIDLAVENGANFVDGFNFQISDPDRYYNIALTNALKDAVKKAEVMQRSTRIILNKTPINITEEPTGNMPSYQPMLLKASTSTPIIPGQIEITANIKAVFQYTQL